METSSSEPVAEEHVTNRQREEGDADRKQDDIQHESAPYGCMTAAQLETAADHERRGPAAAQIELCSPK